MKRRISILVFLSVAMSVVGQTGGGFNLEQNVIGNGGWKSTGDSFIVLGTMGQGNAGSTATGGAFHLIDGLWATENQTAASPFAGVGGRVTRASGLGIPRVLVTLTSPTNGLTAETWTQAQGYYSFAEIPTGATYIVTVDHRHFAFVQSSISMFLSQLRNDVDFVATN